MNCWIKAACEYIESWIEFKMQQGNVPGCVLAIVYRGAPILQRAFGTSDLARDNVPLSYSHWFRIGSLSKSFTAAGIMKLQEQGAIELDHQIGRYNT